MTTDTIAEPYRPALQHLTEVLRGLRAGRATPALVESIPVEAYGARSPLNQLARISTPDPRTIVVEPWDKAIAQNVEKALAASALGVTPVTAGTVIRLPLPAVTEERRQELAKLVKQRVEETKVSIRNEREKLLKTLRGRKDAGTLSEDAFERERKKLQTDVDAATAAAEQRGEEKIADIFAG